MRLLFVLLISNVFFMCSENGKSSTEDTFYFPLTEGSTWLYKYIRSDGTTDRIYTITGKKITNGREYSIRQVIIEYEDASRDTLEQYFRESGENIYFLRELDEDESVFISFPIKKDKEWIYQGSIVARVVDVETLELFGNSYSNCYKIELIGAGLSYWFKNDVGIVKVIDGSKYEELVSYHIQ